MIVGTHALLEDDVEFKKLGLIIIDEQHRFGVKQRARLKAKSLSPELANNDCYTYSQNVGSNYSWRS